MPTIIPKRSDLKPRSGSNQSSSTSGFQLLKPSKIVSDNPYQQDAVKKVQTMSGSLKGANPFLPKGQYFVNQADPYTPTESTPRDVSTTLKIKIRGENEDYEVDHIVPLWLGGTNAVENLQALSKKVHGEKTYKNDTRNNPDSVISKYERGELTLAEARLKILNWDEPDTALAYLSKPETYTAFRTPLNYSDAAGQVATGTVKGIWDLASDNIQRWSNTVLSTTMSQFVKNSTKIGSEARDSQARLDQINATLFQQAKKEQAMGNKDKAERLLKQVQENNKVKKLTSYDLNDESVRDLTGSQVTGQAIAATVDLLPFVKGLGFVPRALSKTGKSTVPLASAILNPKQLINTSWAQLAKRTILPMAGEGAAYGYMYGVAEVLQHENTTPEQKIGSLVNSTGIGFLAGAVLGPLSVKLLGRLGAKSTKELKNMKPVEFQREFQKVLKETPLVNKGIVETNSGNKIVTSQKHILENYIKNSSKLNYRKVRTLPEGVAARFEWDYKAKVGTIYATNKTTASNLSHELGHYFDYTLTKKVQSKLSDLLPNYVNNQSQIDGILSSFAVKRLGGNASTKQITKEVASLVDNFSTEVTSLATARGEMREGLGEQFASAVSYVIDSPAESKKIAPAFTDFIENELERTGIKRAGSEVKYKELFRGENGEVMVKKNTKFKNLATEESQQAVLKRMAENGDEKAVKILSEPFNYAKADKHIMESYRKRKYDAIEYKHTETGKPGEVFDLRAGKHYATEEATARAYSMIRKPASGNAVKKKPKTSAVNAKKTKPVTTKAKQGASKPKTAQIKTKTVKKGNTTSKAKTAPKTLYHGTAATEFKEFKGITYLTDNKAEAKLFSESIHLGGSQEGKQRVLDVKHSFKKVNDVDEAILDAIESGDLEKTIRNELADAKAEGYDAITFMHPSGTDGADFKVYVPVDNKAVKIVTKKQTAKIKSNSKDEVKTLGDLTGEITDTGYQLDGVLGKTGKVKIYRVGEIDGRSNFVSTSEEYVTRLYSANKTKKVNSLLVNKSDVWKLTGTPQEFIYHQASKDKTKLTKQAVIPPAGGKEKISKLSSKVEANAIEKKLTDSFGDLPKFEAASMRQQATKSLDLLDSDIDLATRIALGEENPPPGIFPESVFVAVEEHALKQGDVELLRKLARSDLTSEATLMGQRIRSLGEREQNSPVNTIRDVTKKREKKFTGGENEARKQQKAIAKEIKKKIKIPEREDWNKFINSIEC